METCEKCGKVSTDDIVALPGSGGIYRKADCTRLGLNYPLKYWKCEHCQATYVQGKDFGYHLYEGRLPYVTE